MELTLGRLWTSGYRDTPRFSKPYMVIETQPPEKSHNHQKKNHQDTSYTKKDTKIFSMEHLTKAGAISQKCFVLFFV